MKRTSVAQKTRLRSIFVVTASFFLVLSQLVPAAEQKIGGFVHVYEPLGPGPNKPPRPATDAEVTIHFYSDPPDRLEIAPDVAPREGQFWAPYERLSDKPSKLRIVPIWRLSDKPYYPKLQQLIYDIPDQENILTRGSLDLHFMAPGRYAQWLKDETLPDVENLNAQCRCARAGGGAETLIDCYVSQSSTNEPSSCSEEKAQQLAARRIDSLRLAIERTEDQKVPYRMELADTLYRVGNFCDSYREYFSIPLESDKAKPARKFGIDAAWACAKSAPESHRVVTIENALADIEDAEPIEVVGDDPSATAYLINQWWRIFRLLGDKRFGEIADAINADEIALKPRWYRFRVEVSRCFAPEQPAPAFGEVTEADVITTESLLRKKCQKS